MSLCCNWFEENQGFIVLLTYTVLFGAVNITLG